ncbi:MAG TPA: hypothetical protein VD735_06550 [Candidatus Saccharimonadales bacterium]|nr:hypothetical protein [Candidatus Saccharimonadales bacterium]
MNRIHNLPPGLTEHHLVGVPESLDTARYRAELQQTTLAAVAAHDYPDSLLMVSSPNGDILTGTFQGTKGFTVDEYGLRVFTPDCLRLFSVFEAVKSEHEDSPSYAAYCNMPVITAAGETIVDIATYNLLLPTDKHSGALALTGLARCFTSRTPTPPVASATRSLKMLSHNLRHHVNGTDLPGESYRWYARTV